MAVNQEEEVVLAEDKGNVRLITLNQPRKLNVISSRVVYLLAENLEKWEKDEDAKLVIIKGAGRAFSAGGDLKMFYDGRTSKDSCLEVVYRFYWLCYHIHTYKKPQVALVHGISMGGGASLMVPMKFSVVTEKTVFATPEASIGFHTDCGFSYILSRLPGHLGEYFALTGARLSGGELVASGLATHLVPLDKLSALESHLVSLNSGNESEVKAAIEEFSLDVQIGEESVLNKRSIIDECFSKDSVEEILESFEAESRKEGNEWIAPVLKGLKRSSPTGLKITLRSIRDGRKQTLSECVKKEFRLTMNILRRTISGDVYEKLSALESHLVSLNSGNESEVKAAIEEFSLDVQIGEESVLNKRSIIDECFSKDSVEEILESFEAESRKEGNEWIAPVLKGLKRSSPTGLKITLRSIRDGRKQTLSECVKKEFRLTMNILRRTISGDVYEGIRALTIDKDNSPKWDPPRLGEVDTQKLDLVFQPFEQDFELRIPQNDEQRWSGKYEESVYA